MKLLPVLTILCSLPIAVYAVAQNEPGPEAQRSAQNADTGAPADSAPDATLKLSGGSIAAGIGFVWGHGLLNYRGNEHQFSISGVSVADVGASHISAEGVVTHLDNIADFNGTYVAWTAGLTLGGGGSAVYMKNEHGVIIKILSSTTGLRFNLSGDGVTVTLKS